MRFRLCALLVFCLGAATMIVAPLPGAGATAGPVANQVVAYLDNTASIVQSGIYVQDLQSGTVQHILTDVRAAMPAISPDGTRVAYSAHPTDPGHAAYLELWVARTDGSVAPTELNPQFCNVQRPAWSADGTKIAYGCSGSGSQVLVVDSTSGTQIGVGIGPTAMSPSFSPDGTKLAFQGDGGAIEVIDVNGVTQPVTIAEGTDPRWSPNGSRILYGTTGARNHLYSVNPDGTAPLLISGATPDADDNVQSWAWTSDSRIVFAGRVVDQTNSAGSADLYLVDSAGVQRTPIGATPDIDEAFVSASEPPTPTAPPTVSLTKPSTQFTLSSTVTVAWSGSDLGGPGIARYELRYKKAAYNGPFGAYVYPASWQSLTATSISHRLSRGYDYCYSIRAIDNVGTASGWTTSKCTALALDDRSLAIDAHWVRTTSSSYYASTATYTSTLGARLTRTGAQVKRLALVATTCASCGTVGVYVGSALISTISLHTATTHNQVMFTMPGFTYRTGTVTVKVLTSGKLVRIDGLGISRT